MPNRQPPHSPEAERAVLGAVLGLVTVLSGLGGDVGELGHGIAVAFIATFYGVGAANVWFLPIAMKLKAIAAEEALVREMIMEGILAIQSGDNPRIVKEKLESYLAAPVILDEGDDQSESEAA